MATMMGPLESMMGTMGAVQGLQSNGLLSMGSIGNNYVTQPMGYTSGNYTVGVDTGTVPATSATVVTYYATSIYHVFGTASIQQPLYYQTQVVTMNQPVPLTPAQREEMERQAAEYRKKSEAAKLKAEELLKYVLDDNQKNMFEKEGVFELVVNSKLYRIRPGTRVERLEPSTKKILSYFCIHPATRLPAADEALSQKLMLETDEAAFLSLANETKAA